MTKKEKFGKRKELEEHDTEGSQMNKRVRLLKPPEKREEDLKDVTDAERQKENEVVRNYEKRRWYEVHTSSAGHPWVKDEGEEVSPLTRGREGSHKRKKGASKAIREGSSDGLRAVKGIVKKKLVQ